MKKILIFLLVGFIIPQVTFAAWWNPIKWFKERPDDNSALELKIKELEAKLETKIDERDNQTVEETENRIDDIIEARTQSVVKEKVVTQTVKIDNPELLNKIDLLTKENVDLRLKIEAQASLTQQLNTCKAQLIDLKQSVETVSNIPSTQCQNAKVAYQNAVNAKADLNITYQKAQAEHRAKCGIGCVSEDIERDYKIKSPPLDTEIMKTQADLKVYCE